MLNYQQDRHIVEKCLPGNHVGKMYYDHRVKANGHHSRVKHNNRGLWEKPGYQIIWLILSNGMIIITIDKFVVLIQQLSTPSHFLDYSQHCHIIFMSWKKSLIIKFNESYLIIMYTYIELLSLIIISLCFFFYHKLISIYQYQIIHALLTSNTDFENNNNNNI